MNWQLLLASVSESGGSGGGSPGGPPEITFTTFSQPFAPPTSFPVAYPPGVQANDLLLLICGTDDTTGLNDWVTPAGWTLEYHGGSSTSDATITIFSKVAVGTESGDLTIAGGLTDDLAGMMLRVTNIDPGVGVEVVGAASILTSTTVSAPSITTLTDNSILIGIAAQDGGDAAVYSADTAGYTELTEVRAGTGGGSGFGMVVATRTQATAGASGVCQFTSSRSDGFIAMQLALKPA
ncbi:hypothetical protein vB_RpoS-V16_44 [Ruegeria phage vB_RpoS-V16]|uniref:hypothetical protein n=1 Tax=Ruegeria phage vB_RpoS-V16 TaxID=2218618 RepID=UPI000DCABA81|nr:hypothetical protein JT311_gp44 [Ruegeria phage vB_RpoS-V16]AWY09480.1 hypothetical protein vB_RpoS-V16_44 [Ruegeria phage vB_RpoS-V16]